MKAHSPGFLAITEDAKKRTREISARETLRATAENPHVALVDVREESEFAAGHVAGAIHIGKGVIERDIEHLIPDKEREIHLYCGGGFRSALAADSIQKMGYRNVLSVAGGFKALKEEGARIE